MSLIKYQDGYKYQLYENYVVDLMELDSEHKNLWKKHKILTDYAHLAKGKLTIYAGYAWDGPSGPAIDTKNFMRGSLVHDVLYQLMREDRLDRNVYRIHADEILRKICEQDGMSWLRAWWVYQGVRYGGGPATINNKQIISAP